jgi:hypothetical protein
MAKPKNLLKKAKQKTDKLDWNIFNFLENLLVFCAMPTRSVPKESGVCFQISSKEKDNAICILFNTDRKKDHLVKEATPQLHSPKKPDYVVLYAKGNICIITIIEMKGKDEKRLKGGIEQILQLRDILKREIKEHLPSKFQFKIQAILLAQPNAHIPREEIRKQASQGFIILPLVHQRRAELFNYVSKENERTEKYQDVRLPHDKDEFGFIEKILVEQALPTRIEDNFYAQKFFAGKDREGIYINYALSKDEYAVFFLNRAKAIIGIKPSEGNFAQKNKNRIR